MTLKVTLLVGHFIYYQWGRAPRFACSSSSLPGCNNRKKGPPILYAGPFIIVGGYGLAIQIS
jgi:hypothetical protein